MLEELKKITELLSIKDKNIFYEAFFGVIQMKIKSFFKTYKQA